MGRNENVSFRLFFKAYADACLEVQYDDCSVDTDTQKKIFTQQVASVDKMITSSYLRMQDGLKRKQI